MFSGIITDLGEITFFDLDKKVIEINTKLKNIFLGQSISCSGVCLTVAKIKNNTFLCNLSEETISKTNLNQKKVGDILNLDGSNILTFTLSCNLRKYLTPKCSISIDGISLTVNRVLKDSFNVSAIPYTWENTSLKNSKIGDIFNIEIDMLARYVHGALKNEK